MTENKPIIIDGVDVAGCDFLAKEDDYCSYSGEYRAYKGECGCSDGEMCKDYPNCFYKKALKQLVRKTQECENWKETAKQYVKNEEYYRNQVDQLKAENEQAEQKLKRIREKVQAYINDEADLTPEQVIQIIDEVK